MKLEEKVDYEFERFYLDQMRTSKENIFAHSEEIEMKKKLKEALRELAGEIDDKTEMLLVLQSNLLESAYGFYKDVSREDERNNVRAVVQHWLTFQREQKKRMQAN